MILKLPVNLLLNKSIYDSAISYTTQVRITVRKEKQYNFISYTLWQVMQHVN